MIEFGSDFHSCAAGFISDKCGLDRLGDYRLYACGRHALDVLIAYGGWKRIWIPAYFCYEIIEHLERIGVAVALYDDYPEKNDDMVVLSLPYEDGDVLLRMNFFGLRYVCSNKNIPVPVIEDHSHGVTTDWALKSDADWCVASLRKTIPLAIGGVLWSPKGHILPSQIEATDECEALSTMRYEAMDMKGKYLLYGGNKNDYRSKFLDTEEGLEGLDVSGLDNRSRDILEHFDIDLWTEKKVENWWYGLNRLKSYIKVLEPERMNNAKPFSLVLLTNSGEDREKLRMKLINNSVFPAVLWRMPINNGFTEAESIADRMLSIHCDGRYSVDDIEHICRVILEG